MFKEWVLCDFCCIILPSWSLSTLSSSIIIYHHLHKVPKGMPGRVSYRFSYTPLRIEGIIIYVFLWAVIKTLLTFHWFVDRDPKILADYKPYKTWVVFHPPTPYPNQPGCCMITAHTMLVSPKKKLNTESSTKNRENCHNDQPNGLGGSKRLQDSDPPFKGVTRMSRWKLGSMVS